jgi:hypothetical protein
MQNRKIRPGRLLLAGLLVALAGVTAYAQTDFHVADSVDIHASPQEVYAFLSDSSQARGWSIFFDHITPLPGTGDGGIGAKRRCFRRPDETGPRWDEEVVEATPGVSRRLHVYNGAGFRGGLYDGTEEEVRHRYEEVAPGVTRLTFDANVTKGSALARTLLFMSTPETHRVFRENLENIRAMIEQRDHYQRLYAWEPKSPADPI